MTNLEALTAICPFSANSLLFSKVLADNSVIEADTYSDSSIIELCSAYVAKVLYLQPNTSEGSLSITYDKDKLRSYANQIFRKNKIYTEIISENKINII